MHRRHNHITVTKHPVKFGEPAIISIVFIVLLDEAITLILQHGWERSRLGWVGKGEAVSP